jgi:catechol 2,3-dioxygenase-like lactoylglutathione lyase family enzyme
MEEGMIAHISIGVRDIAAARAFYDAALAPLGYRCLYPGDDSAGYGADDAAFWLNQTTQPVPANPISGLHICFDAPNRKAVDAFYAAGLANGGKDNGKPGLRPDYDAGYYAAFVVDPDGYRLEAYYGKD